MNGQNGHASNGKSPAKGTKAPPAAKAKAAAAPPSAPAAKAAPSTLAAALVLLLALAAVLAGCATRTAPRVTMLGDGVLRSPSPEEAEAYCRNFGAPLRFVPPTIEPAPKGEVAYRCD